MMLSEDLILNEEFKIKFPSLNNKDKKKNNEEFMELADDIRKKKEEIEESDAGQFYKKFKPYIGMTSDLVINWVKFGVILGPATIPFSLTISLLKLLTRKALKYIKTESDKNLVLENIRLSINKLKFIKNNNKENQIIIDKIDSTIVFFDEVIDSLLED